MTAPVPAEAVTAAAGAIYDLLAKPGTLPTDRGQAANRLALAAVEAAAPLIAAAERARIRSLLPYNVNCCEGFPAAVADMIGEHGDA